MSSLSTKKRDFFTFFSFAVAKVAKAVGMRYANDGFSLMIDGFFLDHFAYGAEHGTALF